MKDRVIDIDDRDAQVWHFITDVPKVGSPWQYVLFVLNVIIPGKDTAKSLHLRDRFRHDGRQLLL